MLAQLGSWHQVSVEVLKSGASLRVNDHDRLRKNFSRHLVRDLDFDSHMSIGAPNDKSQGEISFNSFSVYQCLHYKFI